MVRKAKAPFPFCIKKGSISKCDKGMSPVQRRSRQCNEQHPLRGFQQVLLVSAGAQAISFKGTLACLTPPKGVVPWAMNPSVPNSYATADGQPAEELVCQVFSFPAAIRAQSYAAKGGSADSKAQSSCSDQEGSLAQKLGRDWGVTTDLLWHEKAACRCG